MGDVLEFPRETNAALRIANQSHKLMEIDAEFKNLTIYGTSGRILAIIDMKTGLVNVTGDLDQASLNFWSAVGAMCPLKAP